jgi:hypothetical protein
LRQIRIRPLRPCARNRARAFKTLILGAKGRHFISIDRIGQKKPGDQSGECGYDYQ